MISNNQISNPVHLLGQKQQKWPEKFSLIIYRNRKKGFDEMFGIREQRLGTI